VSFDDLPAQDEADTGAAGLGREEGNEEISRLRQTGAVILDNDIEMTVSLLRTHADTASRFGRRIHGVPDEIDQYLLDLVAIDLNC